MENVLATQTERDQRDQRRSMGALKAATDAVIVDTDGQTMDEVVDRLRQNVAEQHDHVAQLRSEIAELEKQNAGYQEQVLKAYQKIKTDEAVVGRAKKAIAIALTLLEEAETQSAEPPHTAEPPAAEADEDAPPEGRA